MTERIAGKIEISIHGTPYDLVGNLTVNLGYPKNEMMTGPNQRTHGHKETPQVPSIKGTVRKSKRINVTRDLLKNIDSTITAEGPDGTRYLLQGAIYTADGNIELLDGEVQFEFEGESATEIAP